MTGDGTMAIALEGGRSYVALIRFSSAARIASTQRPLVIERFHEVLMSVYLYNEHRGYTQLEALASALRDARPSEHALVDAVAVHARDERRHYRMFRAWFVRRGVMPLRIDSASGYIDRLVIAATGASLDTVDLALAAANDAALTRLFRLIVLTERRGLAQVRSLLRLSSVLLDRDMRAMFEVVERDEPAHFLPYEAWLARQYAVAPTRRERWADVCTHSMIVGLGVPRLLCDLRVQRLDAFPA
jgi:hypothetical protein